MMVYDSVEDISPSNFNLVFKKASEILNIEYNPGEEAIWSGNKALITLIYI